MSDMGDVSILPAYARPRNAVAPVHPTTGVDMKYQTQKAVGALSELGIERHNLGVMDALVALVRHEDATLPNGACNDTLPVRIFSAALATNGNQRDARQIHYLTEYFFANFGYEIEGFCEEPSPERVASSSIKKTAASKGWVYILSNPHMPGLVKIGMTTFSVERRIKEISSNTGIPLPFVIEWSGEFENCQGAERMAHKYFSDQRVSSKEFFRISPDEAIKYMESVQ